MADDYHTKFYLKKCSIKRFFIFHSFFDLFQILQLTLVHFYRIFPKKIASQTTAEYDAQLFCSEVFSTDTIILFAFVNKTHGSLLLP
jgi:hypothetical protein